MLRCSNYPPAEFVYAGKQGGHHAMSQDEINRALVESARADKVVSRPLKGGDPFQFGRGGGERPRCSPLSEGDSRVIPGVTSVIAAPASAGIPLAHRDYSSSFAVVTGSEANMKNGSSISWPAYHIRATRRCVFLMGIKNIGMICERLMEAGKAPDTPAAVVVGGPDTEPGETVVATL